MKNNYIKLVWILLLSISFVPVIQAQSPAKMSYQAVIRDADSQLLSNTQVSMQISILQGSADGIAVYIETQTPTSNANGLVSIEIGAGTSSDDLSTIDWANGPYFIKTETDPDGGTNYSITGTSQLLSVPYALHAKTAETVTGGISETDPEFTGSEAANITASDIAKLGNLSGINTGDQNLDALATKTSLAGLENKMDDGDAALKGLIDDNTSYISTNATNISINVQAIKDTASAIRAGIPDVSGFATIAELDADSTYLKGLIDTETGNREDSDDALAAKISSDSTFLKGLIDGNTQAIKDTASAIRAGIPDVSGFATIAELDADSTYLKGLIDTEISDRKAAGAALSTKASSDSTYFEGLISDEETARIAADAAINTELDADSTFLKGFIDGNTQAIKDTASAIRADIPDVSGFATVAELDADSTYLKGLIDGNTQAIKDTASAIRAGIPDVSGFATLTKVRNDSTFLKGLIDDNATIISTNTTDINNLETYAITSAGTSGQVWISDGDGAGSWADAGSSSGVPTGTNTGDMQYWNGTAWVTVAATTNEGAILQMIGGVPTWTGGTPPTPNVTNATTGKTWMDRNLGASQVATSSTDIAAYGDLYQWGRAAD
ncbi:hypothetical protein, partial [Mariniphaga sediminis]|uniref:hypothetical protein n=1 Tax=Mariniphaga sediminis TaxID=1628158 RepID=UPI003563011A